MKIRATIFIFFYFGFAQISNLKSQVSLQDSVAKLFINFVGSENEVKKNDNSKRFSDGLKLALEKDTKGEFTFDSLKKYKVMLESPDKQVRIFTWDVQADDNTHAYFGFVQAYSRKTKKYETYELKDKSFGMRDAENAIIDNTKWFGSYYYQIAEVKHKKTKYYFLLGWNGNNGITWKRVIDVLYFNEKGFPKFGDAIFSDEKGKIKKRIIFEYKAGLVMSLRYDEEKEVIIFDHLSPSDPELEGQYEFYGPDFSYDMMQFRDGKWIYVKNVEPRNGKDRTDKYFHTAY